MQQKGTARISANLMLQGKVNLTLKFFTEDHDKGGILPLTETVLGDMKEKNPEENTPKYFATRPNEVLTHQPATLIA